MTRFANKIKSEALDAYNFMLRKSKMLLKSELIWRKEFNHYIVNLIIQRSYIKTIIILKP